MKIHINTIKVNKDRQREDMGEVGELADSMRDYGQLQPILLDADRNLIAGGRRLQSAILLGWDQIDAVIRENIDPVLAEILELEENIRRKDLEWPEEAKAVERIHKMKLAIDPLWSSDKTAEMVGRSKRHVFNYLQLAREVDAHPELVKAETATGAMQRLKRERDIETRKEAVQVRRLAEDMGMRNKVQAQVFCADAALQMEGLMAESVDMVITNPPFGVDIEDIFIGEKTIYQDAATDIVPVIKAVVAEAYRILKPDRWFVMFYPTARLDEGRAILEGLGFKFQSVPAIWYKPNKYMSNMSRPYQALPIQYETFFWARKGDARFNKLRLGNVYTYDTPGADRIHPLQMPVDLWMEIIEQGSVSGELVVEPFCGSASGGVAAIRSERNYIGIELSPEWASRADMWLSEELGNPTHKGEVVKPLSPFDQIPDLDQDI